MPQTRTSTSSALVAMANVVITSFTIAALYMGREILIPLSLAALLAFLLSPIVTRLERKIGRISATILAVLVLFGAVGGVGYILTRQVLDLATKLPDYQDNLHNRLKSLQMPGTSRFSKVNQTLEKLKQDLPGMSGSTGPDADGRTTVAAPQKPMGNSLPQSPKSSREPTPVEIVETKNVGMMGQISLILGPLVGPLGTGALVLLLLFIMLLQREDLRGRVIRLVGSTNISAATRGLDDAASRVSRYLVMQLIVNATYGAVIAVGLYFIGIPNAFVWGLLATVLRFIPYIGAWIASGFPIALSLAVSSSWASPLLTIGLFLVVELLSNNVMEPMLYGSSTGVSALALIVAAVFWTWIWGPVGLVLATPLTVCLVVLGRHIPKLSILSVLLSDEVALSPHEEFYHRLLTPSSTDAVDFAVDWLKANSKTALYDSVFVPALAIVENDLASGQVDRDQHQGVIQEFRDVLEDVNRRPTVPSKIEADKSIAASEEKAAPVPPPPTCRVVILPVRADRDELSGLMLNQLLVQHEFAAYCLSAKLTSGELIQGVDNEHAELVCISVAPPSTVAHARYLAGKVRARYPNLRILVGLWGATEQLTEATTRLRDSGADEVVTTFADAVLQSSKYAAELALQSLDVGLPPDEEQRISELQNLHLLDSAADPVLDRFTRKLTRILNVPIALITFVDRDRQFFKSQFGLPEDLAAARQTPRDVSVCSQVVANKETLVVEDLARDRRFAKNRLLTERGLRFYAGAPLKTPSGVVLGSLCVLDYQPRKFAENEVRMLQVMAEDVMDAIMSGKVSLPEKSSTVEVSAIGSGSSEDPK